MLPVCSAPDFPRPSRHGSLFPNPCETVKKGTDLIYLRTRSEKKKKNSINRTRAEKAITVKPEPGFWVGLVQPESALNRPRAGAIPQPGPRQTSRARCRHLRALPVFSAPRASANPRGLNWAGGLVTATLALPSGIQNPGLTIIFSETTLSRCHWAHPALNGAERAGEEPSRTLQWVGASRQGGKRGGSGVAVVFFYLRKYFCFSQAYVLSLFKRLSVRVSRDSCPPNSPLVLKMSHYTPTWRKKRGKG